ncbi:MAG: NAD(P)/FAD-dependent oxidoreductase [Desulfopila sp.]
MHYSVVIAGAGPAGLACARILAENHIDVLVIERKAIIGPKPCAGGITWSGLINRIPGQLEEKRFLSQQIHTRRQRVTITEKEPIIATVNRGRLGQHMAQAAVRAGAKIATHCQIQQISQHSLCCFDRGDRTKSTITFDILVGADGSRSLVRRFLALPTEHLGIGINYQIPRYLHDMEWHLNREYFGSGYGWIFPHSTTVSIGAYVDQFGLGAQELKKGLLRWGTAGGFDLSRYRAQAEYINYDYRGHHFDNIFLAGDAAGLASGLTGEGIYSAIVSGEYIGRYIAGTTDTAQNFQRLIERQKLHAKLARLTRKNNVFSELIGEVATFGLRIGLLNFRKLEMAG